MFLMWRLPPGFRASRHETAAGPSERYVKSPIADISLAGITPVWWKLECSRDCAQVDGKNRFCHYGCNCSSASRTDQVTRVHLRRASECIPMKRVEARIAKKSGPRCQCLACRLMTRL